MLGIDEFRTYDSAHQVGDFVLADGHFGIKEKGGALLLNDLESVAFANKPQAIEPYQGDALRLVDSIEFQEDNGGISIRLFGVRIDLFGYGGECPGEFSFQFFEVRLAQPFDCPAVDRKLEPVGVS